MKPRVRVPQVRGALGFLLISATWKTRWGIVAVFKQLWKAPLRRGLSAKLRLRHMGQIAVCSPSIWEASEACGVASGVRVRLRLPAELCPRSWTGQPVVV